MFILYLSEFVFTKKYDHKYPFAPYEFGYDIVDEYGNKNWRREEAQSADHVIGSYGFEDVNGIMRQVDYVADKNGFRAKVFKHQIQLTNNLFMKLFICRLKQMNLELHPITLRMFILIQILLRCKNTTRNIK